MKKPKLPVELEAFSFFSNIPKNKLDKDIGKKIFLKFEGPGMGSIRKIRKNINRKYISLVRICSWDSISEEVKKGNRAEIFTIGQVQTTWNGELAYRIYGEGDSFGRVAYPSDVIFILN